ncbi:hypothetical protein N7478_004552 [Penicillium angulare]|uniref:uncharacterized protein n=1 Tax=Penicillium angulare TaxID=116970 RepID=UPI00253FD695|nr:uncharacterized protein N7478_004552 [Penicillium angulare]KAJ5279180.1 hypothetical protein N7478_004552 [Penicillium angulare]
MECFRQMFRCLKAPFTRREERGIEIGPPTNFRKEELPACFSDAESVISPSQNATERPILTKNLQHVDVARQSGSDNGEERDDDRDDGSPAIGGGQDSDSCTCNEHPNSKPRILERLRLNRWFRSVQRDDHGQDHEI